MNHIFLSSNPRVLSEIPEIQPSKAVSQISPYEATSSRDLIEQKPEQVPLKLDWNESTILPSPKVNQAIINFLNHPNHLNWYSPLNSTNVIQILSEFQQIPPEYFLVSNGSDEALHTVCATYLDSGDRVVYPSPTYQHFLVFAQQEGGLLSPYVSPTLFEPDTEGLIEELHKMPTRICYLVSPNNPTGVIYSPNQVKRLLEASPKTLFIVDEAYAEFSRQSCKELLYTYSNLIITRTFSKAYGLAGCRIGYLMAHPQIIKDLQRVFNPKSVNALAQVAAIAALKDQTYLNAFIDETRVAQKMCVDAFTRMGLHIQSTPANFFLLRTKKPHQLVEALTREGVYVRNRDHLSSLKGYLRMSVGTVSQMKEMLRRFQKIHQEISS